MKFYPPALVRYCFRYVWIILFIGVPLWLSTPMFWNVVVQSDVKAYITMCWIFAICGTVVTHFVWDKFFAVLILSEESIYWKCPFRKSKNFLLLIVLR